jgi:1-pyrroline-5-carboxylate dehydrogenase
MFFVGPYRPILNGATVLGQSKNFFQAEIDSACELIDFLRFNAKCVCFFPFSMNFFADFFVRFAEQIISEQPISSPGMWNRLQYRALEGFIYCVSPFNFTAIAGNLTSAPAFFVRKKR